MASLQRRAGRGFCFGLLAVSLVVPAAAQESAGTFDELRFKVRIGDTVYVTGDDGREREARILELSPSALVVSLGGARNELTEGSVRRIRQRMPDSKSNGMLIGFAVAAAGVTFMAKTLESPDGSCGTGCVAFAVLGGGGLGALVGAGIDGMVMGKRTIYTPQRPAPRAFLQPLLGRGTTGLRVSVAF